MVPSTERVGRELGGSLSISGIISGPFSNNDPAFGYRAGTLESALFGEARPSDAALVESIDIVQHLRYIAQC